MAISHTIIWTNKNNFVFSTDKTHCIYFGCIPGVHRGLEILINRQQISVSGTARLSGVFHKKITFLPHTLNLQIINKSFNILKVLTDASWGVDHVSLLKIYRTIIQSRLDYACQVYGSAGFSYLKKLDTVHHSALLICTSAFHTSCVVS